MFNLWICFNKIKNKSLSLIWVTFFFIIYLRNVPVICFFFFCFDVMDYGIQFFCIRIMYFPLTACPIVFNSILSTSH